MKSVHALVIDLEDWYHPELVRNRIYGDPEGQIEGATQLILDLLARYQFEATFFVVGEVAEKHPELIRKIFEGGHEIGSHGFSHRPLWGMDEDYFKEEMIRFHSVIRDVLGAVKIRGFRAPTFSLDNRTRWAINVLKELGYEYDASIFPVKLNRLYGLRGAPTIPYRLSSNDLRRVDPDSLLLEFPMTVLEWLGLKIPVGGGFYFRVIPLIFLRLALRKIGQYHSFLLYFHPWEGYEGTPRLRLPLTDWFITYYGIGRTWKKLESLFRDFQFTRVDRILGLTESRP